MVQKNQNTLTSLASTALSHVGLTVMFAGALINMAELAEREGSRVAVALQPNYAFATQPVEGQGNNDEMTRRAKEEIGHTSTSYGSVRRSHSIAGTL